ncbi:Dolichyl pyrophosphate Man9 c2 alpha-1,3-glucosyltransferase [Paramuricea clavata]|uniref:Alpha-1,3-glucosyltransferase n=1 Tax=Paramuricea clavata TaxID=317549 RepID=A0A6S7HSF2_PARCT|nr:Dolichyl pyrophosphate Man9 c2 alpha-1,3-glucosyltransferase [Paramuricea clavata]
MLLICVLDPLLPWPLARMNGQLYPMTSNKSFTNHYNYKYLIYYFCVQDKVANVWCSLSILIKFKDIFSTTTLVKICGCSTVAFVLPSNLMLALRPSPKSFLLALVNSSLAFFLFSYHVHEKSILLVTLPASLLLPLQPLETIWFLFITLFSMIPLLEKDGLLLAYIPCMLLFLLLAFSFHLDLKRTPTTIKFLFFSSIACCILLHVVSHLIVPPRKYPDIFPLLISMYSCGHFLLFFIYSNFRQYKEYCAVADKIKKKS